MFSGSLGFFCFHFKQRKGKNSDHVFARRKKRKMATKKSGAMLSAGKQAYVKNQECLTTLKRRIA